jgi:hypothetical protein
LQGYRVPELGPGEQNVVEYGMFMPPNLPPRDFFLRVQLLLNDAGEFVPTLVFNQTISVVEQSKLVDTELLGLYSILLSILVAAGEQIFT